jgi:hypothetical protein
LPSWVAEICSVTAQAVGVLQTPLPGSGHAGVADGDLRQPESRVHRRSAVDRQLTGRVRPQPRDRHALRTCRRGRLRCRGSHSRYFWGFRLHAILSPDGTPRALELCSPSLMSARAAGFCWRCQRHGGDTLLRDKGYACRGFAAAVSDRDATFARPRRKAERGTQPHLAPIRQRIEAILWPCTDLLILERRGARTLAAVRTDPRPVLLPRHSDHSQPSTRTPKPCVNYCA